MAKPIKISVAAKTRWPPILIATLIPILALTDCSPFSAATSSDGGAATPVDGGTTPTTPPDGGNPSTGEASAPFSCLRTPATIQCTDFESGLPPEWMTIHAEGGSTFNTDDQGNKSARALELFVPPDGEPLSVCAKQPLPLPPLSNLSVEVDVRVDQQGSLDLDLFTFVATDGYEIGLSLSGLELRFEEDSPTLTQKVTPTGAFLKSSTYARVRFVTRVEGVEMIGEISVDGVLAGTVSLTKETSWFNLDVGDCGLSTARGWLVHLDNFVVERQ